MANTDHLELLLMRGVDTWNKWRESNPEVKPELCDYEFKDVDLRYANLADADLTGSSLVNVDLCYAVLCDAVLEKANLSEALLSAADLYRADLSGVNLTEADLVRATLENADLQGADVSGANFAFADLSYAYLSHAKIIGGEYRNANFRAAVFGRTTLADVDLSSAIELEQARHSGPSPITISTLVASRGQIPDSFLRGTGVPDAFITYAKSLTSNPVEFYSCFISFSTKDQDFADRLYSDLQSNGVRSWFAPHDAQRGRKLHEQIDEAIRVHEKLLLILSPNSMSSEWVKTEISKARKREVREKIQVLFPVSLVPFQDLRDWECFDADTGKDSAREIREYLIADFHCWKDHDAYKIEFKKLLRDLKTDKPLAGV